MTEGVTRTAEPRRYRVLDVIGRGGFGTVYRARLEGPDGFFKEVAIKLMRADDTPREVLQRFRDEARILGLVRDRAIISVDPPTKLAGRWAVVMEYVDGASAARLVRAGPMPAGVVMEVAEEIARALHKIYRHPGRDGRPLCLVHRDIKPANIQISPAGEVKLLDFGIARADFTERESDTTLSIGGTRGYIAPERLHGIEGAEGDIFSLGVVIHKLATGELPDENDLGWTPGEPEPDLNGDPYEAFAALASKMRALRPQDRPTAREVQTALAALRARMDEEPLSAWAERVVPGLSRLAEDELVGTVLSETLSDVRPDEVTAEGDLPDGFGVTGSVQRTRDIGAPQPMLAWVGAAVGLAAVLGVLSLALIAMSRPTAVVPAPAPIPVPTEVVPEPAPEPAPTRPRVTKPDPAPAPEPAPTEERADGLLPVRITSIPFGATLSVDNQEIGVTPQLDLALQPGTHKVVLVLGDRRTTREIAVGPGLASRFVWRVEEGAWDVGF